MTAVVERGETEARQTSQVTLPQKVKEWASRTPNGVAMREKDFGIWQEITWSDFWERVTAAAHGLLALGVEPGDRVSIQSEDRPEWVILDVATVAVRGITVGLYPTNPESEVEYLLSDSGSKIHLAEDQEQADKVVQVLSELPNIRKIIHVEPRGFRQWRGDDRFIYWDDFLEMGRKHREENPGRLEDLMGEAEAEELMTLVYTSGTTGPPKGAMLTNANFDFCLQTLVSATDRLPGNILPHPDDQILTYLPLCHVAERIFSTWTMAGYGSILNFAESIDTVQQNLREIQPTLFFAVPRIWEKLHAGILIKGKDATFFKRIWFGAGLRLAQVIGRKKVANGGEHTLGTRLLAAVGYPLVFRPLLERVGLRRVRWSASGAAPIAPEVLEFFIGMGVPLYELYGMTENSAVAT
ncbi:MAG: AMP-dependent synthetase/ligase, partial [Acidimicrobiia bacterium]